MTRKQMIHDLLARATLAGRAVYGFSSGYPSCERVLRGKVPTDFDWLCVEGDQSWTAIPPSEADT